MLLRPALLVLALTASSLAWGEASDPPDRVVRLSYVEGEVTFQGAQETARHELPDRPLIPGDRLTTERGGRAELSLGTATIRLDEQHRFLHRRPRRDDRPHPTERRHREHRPPRPVRGRVVRDRHAEHRHRARGAWRLSPGSLGGRRDRTHGAQRHRGSGNACWPGARRRWPARAVRGTRCVREPHGATARRRLRRLGAVAGAGACG